MNDFLNSYLFGLMSLQVIGGVLLWVSIKEKKKEDISHALGLLFMSVLPFGNVIVGSIFLLEIVTGKHPR